MQSMRFGRGRPRGAAQQRARTGGGHQIPDRVEGMIRELDRRLEEAREGGEQVAGVREAALLGLRRHVATVGFLRIAEAINTWTSGVTASTASARGSAAYARIHVPPGEPFYDDTEEHLRRMEVTPRGRASPAARLRDLDEHQAGE